MKWDDSMRKVIKDNYPQKSCKELAEMLRTTVKSIERQICDLGLSGLKKEFKRINKQSYTKIGCRRRANNKYNAIITRTTAFNNPKNNSYRNVKLKVGREDFINWYMPLDFEGASVDRINKDGDYELSNMQVISLKENISKDKIKCKNGICQCYRCGKDKPIGLFAKDNRRSNGHSTICLECDKERSRIKYHKYKNKGIIQGGNHGIHN